MGIAIADEVVEYDKPSEMHTVLEIVFSMMEEDAVQFSYPRITILLIFLRGCSAKSLTGILLANTPHKDKAFGRIDSGWLSVKTLDDHHRSRKIQIICFGNRQPNLFGQFHAEKLISSDLLCGCSGRSS